MGDNLQGYNPLSDKLLSDELLLDKILLNDLSDNPLLYNLLWEYPLGYLCSLLRRMCR